MEKPQYIKWITREEACIRGCECDFRCFKINYNNDPTILNNWALHIRRHYITDIELSNECALLRVSQENYLKDNILPQRNDPMGSTARSNVITEVLISDLLEFIYNYHVPRVKYYNLSGKTESEQGTDVIGYCFANSDNTPSSKDVLVAAEVKACLSRSDVSVITKSVEHSVRDEYRLSRTLNHVRRKLRDMGNQQEAEMIKRFQLKTTTDYRVKYVAAGITNLNSLDRIDVDGNTKYTIPNFAGDKLYIRKDQSIFFIHGNDLMSLTHEIYERCYQ